MQDICLGENNLKALSNSCLFRYFRRPFGFEDLPDKEKYLEDTKGLLFPIRDLAFAK